MLPKNIRSLLCISFSFIGLVSSVALANSETELEAILNERSIVAEALEAASTEFSVPLPLLQAIAYEATRWQHIVPRKPDEFLLTYGVMGLSDNTWLGEDLNAAANLLGAEVATLKYDITLNVRGAAALLNALAEQASQEGIPVNDDLASWLPVLERYSNLQIDELDKRYVQRILNILVEGVDEPGITIPRVAALEPVIAAFSNITETQVAQYPEAIWIGPLPANNFGVGRDGEVIDQIILHTLEISPLTAESWFKNPEAEASAHYLINIAGDVYQLLEHEHTAYTAGNLSYNQRSINIELEGSAGRPMQDWQTEEQLQALTKLISWLREHYAIPLDRNHILGHNQVPSISVWCDGPEYWGGCSNHYDPGAYLNLTKLMANLGRSPNYQVVEATSNCEVRVLSTSEAPRTTSIAGGHKFAAYDEQDGFYLIFLVGVEDPQPNLEVPGEYHWDGWVAADCVNPTTGIQLEVSGAFPALLRIRSAPNSDAPVVTRSIDGQRLVATGTTEPDPNDPERTWFEVYLANGQLGWVRDDLLEVF